MIGMTMEIITNKNFTGKNAWDEKISPTRMALLLGHIELINLTSDILTW